VEFTLYQPPVYNHQEAKSDTSALDSHRNPAGRTGIKGRGALKSLGPNHIVDPVITTEGGVLEFLALWEQTEGCWKFPGGYVDDSRNTDNAWVETTVVTVHLQWHEVSSKIAMCPYQKEALRLVAQLHHINF
uniref:Nudix hydrolase domain-containing protein n=1 Tax=Astyanax mexicanus TaxID=7994 RepID=A0A3B1KJL0_ASTMX